MKLILVIRIKTFRFMQLLKRIPIIFDRSVLCLLYWWLASQDLLPVWLPVWPCAPFPCKKKNSPKFDEYLIIYYSIYNKKKCHGQSCVSFKRMEVKLRHLTLWNLSFVFILLRMQDFLLRFLISFKVCNLYKETCI